MEMDVDWPFPKRRKVGCSSWWEAPEEADEETSALLWGLCDALEIYASATQGGASAVPEDAVAGSPHEAATLSQGRLRRGSPGSHGVVAFGSPSSSESGSGVDSPVGAGSGSSIHHRRPELSIAAPPIGQSAPRLNTTSPFVSPHLVTPPSPSPERSGNLSYAQTGGATSWSHASSASNSASCVVCPGSGQTPRPNASAPGNRGRVDGIRHKRVGNEPLLRTLTQLANTAASCVRSRRQLVSECQVHAPLLRVMLGPWARQPHVAERCCRLVHWLCARNTENREVIATHRNPSMSGDTHFSFVDAALSAAEMHPRSREVTGHAVRALAALLPCTRVSEELRRSQQRFLSCLMAAGEALDASAVRSVCRWLPGVSGQLRQARAAKKDAVEKAAVPGPELPVVAETVPQDTSDGEKDVEMDEL